MAYAVKEIFYSLQGEGAHAGRPAIFCRFTGLIYGADKRNIALMLFVSSVIPILWVQMEMVEVVLRMLWP